MPEETLVVPNNSANNPLLTMPSELIPDEWKDHVRDLRRENQSLRELTKVHAEDTLRKVQETTRKMSEEQEGRLKDVSIKAEQRIIHAELKADALMAGMIDLDGLKLADLSAVSLDAQGQVVGAQAAIQALREAKPFLFAVPANSSNPNYPPKKEEAKPFDARTASAEERAAKAKELGVSIKAR